MATRRTSIKLNGLARRLVDDGLLTESTASQVFERAVAEQRSFVSMLVADDLVGATALAVAAANEYGLPLFDLDVMDMDQSAVSAVDTKLLQRHHALPLFKRGKRLHVAISDPVNLQALDDIKFQTGLHTEPVLVAEDQLSRILEREIDNRDSNFSGLLDDDLDNLQVSAQEEEEPDASDTEETDDAPVVRFVNKVLLDAIKKGASDIHFEPYEKDYRVRFRVDGVLQEMANPPANLANRLAARVKVMSGLDIAERRVPQDGRIKMNLSRNRAIDFRVSTCPTLYGEKIVARILDADAARLGIDALGYEEEQKARFLEAIHKPYGMVLVTGPTGSGKTVSLYTALNILNQPNVNISTVEDPVEINLPGINQVNVNPKTGLTFASALRAFLRQDPDIVMVGEIRDLETAEIAIKAAQTGHLVLSTLHTNDAPQTLTRLMNMGVPSYNIASSVSLIIAQRLARRLCKHCKAPEDIPREALLKEGFTEEEIPNLTVFKAVGCDQCTGGYKGRVGIYQVMPVSEAIGRLIMAGGTATDIEDQSRKEGIFDLRAAALNKVREGTTSLEEINRVTRD